MPNADVEQAARILRDGGIVAMPTETVYGLAADALNERAVARVFEVKQRPGFDPLIVHIAFNSSLDQLVTEVSDAAHTLVENCWPGPLTLVLPKADIVPDIVTAGLDTVGIRMPDHPVALELIHEARSPLAAPSANRFGHISPTTADHVRSSLGDKVDYILDAGPCRTGVESTVLLLTGNIPTILRPGGTPREVIEQHIGPVNVAGPDQPNRPQSPGMTERHYAPRTPLTLVESLPAKLPPGRVGLLTLRPTDDARFAVRETLSESGEPREAAANLFAALHRLDAANLDAIIAVRVPDQGLGVTINDRLNRAATLPVE